MKDNFFIENPKLANTDSSTKNFNQLDNKINYNNKNIYINNENKINENNSIKLDDSLSNFLNIFQNDGTNKNFDYINMNNKETFDEFGEKFSEVFKYNSSLDFLKNENKTERNDFQLNKQKSEKIFTKCKNKKRYRNFKIRKRVKNMFRNEHTNFAKSGNNLKKNSGRKRNRKIKIVRNFTQDIVIDWLNNGQKNKIRKIKYPFIIFNKYIILKGKKLEEIYSEDFTHNNKEKEINEYIDEEKMKEFKIINNEDEKEHNNNIIKNSEGILKNKLNLTFEQVFKAFCSDNFRRKIEKNYGDKFFVKFKDKNHYIYEKSIKYNEKKLFEESIIEILNEFNISLEN